MWTSVINVVLSVLEEVKVGPHEFDALGTDNSVDDLLTAEVTVTVGPRAPIDLVQDDPECVNVT